MRELALPWRINQDSMRQCMWRMVVSSLPKQRSGILTSWVFLSCVIPCPWVWTGDIILMTRIWQSWWAVISVINHKRLWLPSCSTLSLLLSCLWSVHLSRDWGRPLTNSSWGTGALAQWPTRNWTLPKPHKWKQILSRSLELTTPLGNTLDWGLVRNLEAEDPVKPQQDSWPTETGR